MQYGGLRIRGIRERVAGEYEGKIVAYKKGRNFQVTYHISGTSVKDIYYQLSGEASINFVKTFNVWRLDEMVNYPVRYRLNRKGEIVEVKPKEVIVKSELTKLLSGEKFEE